MNIDYEKFELDVKNTLISNTVYLLSVLLIGVFVIKSFDLLMIFETEDVRLLGTIIFTFAFVRLVYWLRLPNLEYKPRQ